MRPLLYQIAASALFATFSTVGTAEIESTTRDWEQVGAIARAQAIPVVVAVIGPCGHCERMKRDFLSDPKIQSFLRGRTLVRIYDKGTCGKITDFDGERLRARLFTSRYDIFATPTLLFLAPDGKVLADPLVGYNDAASYLALVSGRLKHAQLALEAGRSAPP